jgi:S1-C subfamily serine protease
MATIPSLVQGRQPIRPVAVAAAALLLLAAVAAGAGCSGDGATAERDFEQVARSLEPSIVTVEVDTKDSWQGGTGVVWSRQGLVVTANHVVDRGERVTVRDARDRESTALVLATDDGLDLALLRIPRDDLVPARFAETLPELGALAVTVGRPPPDDTLRWEGGRIEQLHAVAFRARGWDDLIQSDADVRHGDSGGALAGPGPVVYGILLASDLAGGLKADEPAERAYAVAAPRVRAFVARALGGRPAEPGFLGIDAADVTPELESRHGLEVSTGVVILAVEPGTPADRGGLRFKDAIVAIDGTPVERLGDLDEILRQRAPGSRISVAIRREGAERTVEVVLARRPSDDD